MFLSVFVLVGVVLLIVLGYRLDDKNGLERGALLQFNTRPTGATVSVDGKDLFGATPTKTTVLSGAHDVQMTLKGYRAWSKHISVQSGTLTWLDYALLIPTNLTTESVKAYGASAQSLISSDGKTIVTLPDPKVTSLDVTDIANTTPVTKTIPLPEGLSSSTDHNLSLLRITGDGNFALLQDNSEYIVVKLSDANQSVNLTRLFNVAFSRLEFLGNNGDDMYGLVDGALRFVNISSTKISDPLISGINSFRIVSDDTIAYFTTDTIGLYQRGADAPIIVRQVPAGTAVNFAVDQYHSDSYLAISVGNVVDIYKDSIPRSDNDVKSLKKVISIIMENPITSLDFSPRGQYLLAQDGTSFSTYDIELAKSYLNAKGTAHWLNEANLYSTDDGDLTLREFDGTNYNQLGKATAGSLAALVSNNQFIYSFGTTAGGTQVQRISLKASN